MSQIEKIEMEFNEPQRVAVDYNHIQTGNKNGKEWAKLPLVIDGSEKILFMSLGNYLEYKDVLQESTGIVNITKVEDGNFFKYVITPAQPKNGEGYEKQKAVAHSSEQDKIRLGNAKNVAGIIYAALIKTHNLKFDIEQFKKIMQEIYDAE